MRAFAIQEYHDQQYLQSIATVLLAKFRIGNAPLQIIVWSRIHTQPQ